jgi:hypothetical protein
LISRSFTARSTKKAQTPILFSSATVCFFHHRIPFFLSPLLAMKNFLMLALVAFATIEANAQTSQPATTKAERKAERKAARQAKQPQVYKGSVAERRRVLTDAAGSEGDSDDDATTTKSSKKSKSKN